VVRTEAHGFQVAPPVWAPILLAMTKVDPFNQPPPQLGNQYDDDVLLRHHLERVLPPAIREAVTPELREMGALAVDLYHHSLETRLEEPSFTQWDAWGNRVDRIENTSLWKRAEKLAAEKGVVAAAYDSPHGAHARTHQFALTYLFAPSSDVFSCPLAMTDGAARTLLASGNRELIDAAVPHLTSRDPEQFWTSGQWMTESTGGSDVGRSETVAVQGPEGWRLHGRKWFTSAATSQMALTLARPEGNAAGGRGLALFYVRCQDDAGNLDRIRLHRLKDKLGTRKLPTAELFLDGTPAIPVKGTDSGVKHITPMLNITRTWNAVSAIGFMRRGIALARDYAKRRVAFGAPLSEKPLHIDTLATLQAELEGAFLLTFRVVELLGRHEHGELDEAGSQLLRLLTPITKLTTARQGVEVASEVLEAFGGAGYVEDTGLPSLLRDAQVLSIWEGTTNVLSLDTLRALGKGDAMRALTQELQSCRDATKDAALQKCAESALSAASHAAEWLSEAHAAGGPAVEAGARRFAMTLGRATELALICRHAQWALDTHGDRRARAAAIRFAQTPLDRIVWTDPDDAALLANDEAR